MGIINTIKLFHFKAFKDEVIFKFEGKNSLIFGENGSGKTSLFEAFKLLFFYKKLERSKIAQSDTPEDENAKRNQLYESYRNAYDTSVDFSIQINGLDYTNLIRDDFRVFLVTLDDFNLYDDCILLDEIMERLFFDFNECTPKELLKIICEDLESAVNQALNNQFHETVQIRIDNSDHFRCVLCDLDGKMVYGTNIGHYFNEGKVHLILIVIYIVAP